MTGYDLIKQIIDTKSINKEVVFKINMEGDVIKELAEDNSRLVNEPFIFEDLVVDEDKIYINLKY